MDSYFVELKNVIKFYNTFFGMERFPFSFYEGLIEYQKQGVSIDYAMYCPTKMRIISSAFERVIENYKLTPYVSSKIKIFGESPYLIIYPNYKLIWTVHLIRTGHLSQEALYE
jgi:hypothetical protein